MDRTRSASRLTTSPVTAFRSFGLRSSNVPLVISSSDRNLYLKRAASTNSSISGRSVGSPPVITMESLSLRMPSKQSQRLPGGQLVAEDVRLLLRAVTTGEVALVRHIKSDGVGRHHFGVQHMPPPRIPEIELKIFRHERRLSDQPSDKLPPRRLSLVQRTHRHKIRLLRHGFHPTHTIRHAQRCLRLLRPPAVAGALGTKSMQFRHCRRLSLGSCC